MSRRATIWLAVAVIFILGNIAGGIYAAAQGEAMHAGLHAVLTLAGLLAAMVLGRGRTLNAAYAGAGGATSASSNEITDRLSQLEHSVDAVAIEVERIGEGQRFMTRVLTQDKQPADARPDDANASVRRPPGETSG